MSNELTNDSLKIDLTNCRSLLVHTRCFEAVENGTYAIGAISEVVKGELHLVVQTATNSPLCLNAIDAKYYLCV